MAYIGREPSYGAFEKQSLTADSSTTSFALNYVVGSSSSIMVSVLTSPSIIYFYSSLNEFVKLLTCERFSTI